MLVLLVLTGISLICVISNVGQIVVGFRSLPIYKVTILSAKVFLLNVSILYLFFLFQQTVDLGITSLSSLGVFGVLIEVVLIGYLFITSSVGLYTIPVIKKIKPMRSNTSLTHIILNCGLYVILSSALPLLSKILGKSLQTFPCALTETWSYLNARFKSFCRLHLIMCRFHFCSVLQPQASQILIFSAPLGKWIGSEITTWSCCTTLFLPWRHRCVFLISSPQGSAKRFSGGLPSF